MHCDTPDAIVILSGGNMNAVRIIRRPEVPSWCVQRKHGSEVVRTVLFMQRLVNETHTCMSHHSVTADAMPSFIGIVW